MGNKRVCVKCDSEFVLNHGKPGKINECPECSEEVFIYRAEGSASEEEGYAFTMRLRPHDEVTELKPAYLRIARDIEKETKVDILSRKERAQLIKRKKDEDEAKTDSV